MDGAGNIAFLRTLRTLESEEMTGAFMTTWYTAQLLPPGAFSILLKFFELPSISIAGSVGMNW